MKRYQKILFIIMLLMFCSVGLITKSKAADKAYYRVEEITWDSITLYVEFPNVSQYNKISISCPTTGKYENVSLSQGSKFTYTFKDLEPAVIKFITVYYEVDGKEQYNIFHTNTQCIPEDWVELPQGYESIDLANYSINGGTATYNQANRLTVKDTNSLQFELSKPFKKGDKLHVQVRGSHEGTKDFRSFLATSALGGVSNIVNGLTGSSKAQTTSYGFQWDYTLTATDNTVKNLIFKGKDGGTDLDNLTIYSIAIKYENANALGTDLTNSGNYNKVGSGPNTVWNSDEKAVKVTTSNYSQGIVFKFNLPEGDTLADYESLQFNIKFDSENPVSWKTIRADVANSMWPSIINGDVNNATFGIGPLYNETSTSGRKWLTDQVIPLSNRSQYIKRTGEVYVAVGLNAGSVTSSDNGGNAYFINNVRLVRGEKVTAHYEYTVSEKKATITKYIGYDVNLKIPDTLGGYPVTAIGEKAFLGCDTFREVIIPNSVSMIEQEAFSNCKNLESITFQSKIPPILGTHVFINSNNLFGIDVPAGSKAAYEDVVQLKTYIHNKTYFENLSNLEDIATVYNNGNEDKVKYPYGKVKWLVSSFIRSFNPNYKTSNWSKTAGSIDLEFERLVKEDYSEVYDYFNQTTYFYAGSSGQKIDLYHQFATFSALLYYNDYIIPDYHYNLLAGWAGDLQTLMNDFMNKYPSLNVDDEYSNAYDKFYEMIGDEKYSFGLMDLYADVDTVNVYNMLNKEKKFYDTYKDYYSKYKDKRFQLFYESIGNNKETVYNKIYVYTYRYVILSDLITRWPLFSLTPTDTFSAAAAAAFNDYLYKLRKEE